eukprot:4484282-Prymnesium_polylepis.2
MDTRAHARLAGPCCAVVRLCRLDGSNGARTADDRTRGLEVAASCGVLERQCRRSRVRDHESRLQSSRFSRV